MNASMRRRVQLSFHDVLFAHNGPDGYERDGISGSETSFWLLVPGRVPWYTTKYSKKNTRRSHRLLLYFPIFSLLISGLGSRRTSIDLFLSFSPFFLSVDTLFLTLQTRSLLCLL